MNICLVSREFPTDDHTGGIATYTEKTARALVRLGHEVSVLTETEGLPQTTSEEGVTVIRLPAPRGRWPLIARARQVSAAIAGLPRPPAIVQACEYRAEAFWYTARSRPGTKLVTRLATPTFLADDLNRHDRTGSGRTRIVSRLERFQTRRSDAIISPTDALADIVCHRWGIARESVATIRTGVEFATRYADRHGALPETLESREYLLYFGRLEERKGVHILGEALPRVLASHPELHVVFVGNVQQYRGESLRTVVERQNAPFLDRLHFLPRLSQPDLYPILERALFVVLPSLWENLANTCLEALDMGKPVVATLGCGFGEVIDDGQTGMLVPPGDALALEEALLTMLLDRDRLARMSQAARAQAQAFSQETVARDLVQFYESLGENGVGMVPSVSFSSRRTDCR